MSETKACPNLCEAPGEGPDGGLCGCRCCEEAASRSSPGGGTDEALRLCNDLLRHLYTTGGGRYALHPDSPPPQRVIDAVAAALASAPGGGTDEAFESGRRAGREDAALIAEKTAALVLEGKELTPGEWGALLAVAANIRDGGAAPSAPASPTTEKEKP